MEPDDQQRDQILRTPVSYVLDSLLIDTVGLVKDTA